ncbi:hypothetical protein ACHAWX_001649 [Stephanocyclus meneghinianus]
MMTFELLAQMSAFNFSCFSPLISSITALNFHEILLTILSCQMIVDIIHPGRANVAKSELQGVVGSMYKTASNLVVLFGFRTKYGGGKSTGFCVIYDSEDALRKFEPKHRLIRLGIEEKKERSRKAIKEAKNKGKKIRGTGASIAKHKAKRAAQAD